MSEIKRGVSPREGFDLSRAERIEIVDSLPEMVVTARGAERGDIYSRLRDGAYLTVRAITKNQGNLAVVALKYGISEEEAKRALSSYKYGVCFGGELHEWESRPELTGARRQKYSRKITRISYEQTRFMLFGDPATIIPEPILKKRERYPILTPAGLLAARCTASGINLPSELKGTMFNCFFGYVTKIDHPEFRQPTYLLRIGAKSFRVWDQQSRDILEINEALTDLRIAQLFEAISNKLARPEVNAFEMGKRR